jgi:hypothetical protein
MPFEILTANDNPGDVRLTRESLRGARIACNLHAVGNWYVVKPVHLEHFSHVMKSVEDFWLSTAVLPPT